MDIPNKALFRPDELAVILNVSTRTIYYWISVGTIRARKIGVHTLRITKDEVERMCNGIPTLEE